MKLLITGATGFLGRYTVASALRYGHHVSALVRPASDWAANPWSVSPNVERVCGDLRQPRDLAGALDGVDAVLHLAATKEGDIYEQLAGTVIGTENLLRAMDQAGVGRLILTSTFAVYDYLHQHMWSRIDETTPLETSPAIRDEYAQSKLIQEQLVRAWAASSDHHATILRPGVVYGPGNWWTARLGAQMSDRWWVRTGAWAKLPLTYVENCADAIVMAAEKSSGDVPVFNVVDDEMPTQRRYLNEVRKRIERPPHVLPVAWTVMRLLARSAWLTNRIIFKDRARVPGLLSPARLHARCKPLRYSNVRLKSELGWNPRYGLCEGLDRCFASDDVLAREHWGSDMAVARPESSTPTAEVAPVAESAGS